MAHAFLPTQKGHAFFSTHWPLLFITKIPFVMLCYGEQSTTSVQKHRHAKRARVIFLVIGSRSIRRTVHSNDLVKFFGGVAMYSKKETGNL